MSNLSNRNQPPQQPPPSVDVANTMYGTQQPSHINAITIAPTHAVADTGATSIFVMNGVDVVNRRMATKPLIVNLPDGRKVRLTHVCDITIPGLPGTLTGHIIPALKTALLIGIHPLCKVGCKVVFNDVKFDVVYKGRVILQGYKDPSMDLWTLPITIEGMRTTPSHKDLPQACLGIGRAPHPPQDISDRAAFLHSIQTQANNVKFAHQPLCNPKISTLLKATQRGFLKGCPYISAKLINKYLNPSPATVKGYMKRPCHGIQSTTPRARTEPAVHVPVGTFPPAPVPSIHSKESSIYLARRPIEGYSEPHRTISEDNKESIANIFVFGAFADKNNGIVYHDLTGSFPFMSLDGSVCFFVLYHNKSNCILPAPISGLDDVSIFNTYTTQFEELVAKGFTPKLNMMDNQATKHIKKNLTDHECKLQLVEPHNHEINAAERAIQTFKDAFIAALATTDSEFPLQLWDRLTPQVRDTLNLMLASHINPAISAYEALNGPYGWNRYPLASLGCKAIVYKDGDTRGSWASWGKDGWYLGPSKDHYKCALYYIPEIRAYCISGSTELFMQHCQLPNLSADQHFCALTNELAHETATANKTPTGRHLIKLLQSKITEILEPTPDPTAQKTQGQEQRVRELQQLEIDEAPILTIPRILNAPPIMKARNPTAKRVLKNTPHLH